MRQATALRLTVNGRLCEARAAANTTLLQVLRDELGLTGTKRGCNQGVCGACTVLIDHQPNRACLSLACNLEGRAITTIEGLAGGQSLTAVQQAIIDCGAVQCGFCTPGMLMSAHALLRDNPRPTPAEVRIALAGNLCRCSGYLSIVEAVCRASQELA